MEIIGILKMTKQHLTFRETAKSVLASFLGIQSQSNRIRDFEKGKPLDFIIIGTMFTLIFVLAILSLVFIILN